MFTVETVNTGSDCEHFQDYHHISGDDTETLPILEARAGSHMDAGLHVYRD